MPAGGPFADTWNPTYETLPGDPEDQSLGAGRIRDFKTNTRQRIQTDHSMNGNADDGCHDQCTFLTSSTDPAAYVATDSTGASFIYSKIVSGVKELFYKDSAGHVLQITTNGAINFSVTQQIPPGMVQDFAGTTAPTGWLECNGQLVSTSTYANLFAAIGYTWGGSGGSFNVPNLNGNTTVGRNGSQAGLQNVGQTFGENTHTLSTAEIPVHNHPVTDPQHSHGTGSSNNFHTDGTNGLAGGSDFHFSTIVATATNSTGITVGNTGSGNSHNNIQPSSVMLKCIKT